MSPFDKYFPIAALVAILLFLARESMEFLRRKRADHRKLHAIQRLLARDCQVQYWVIKSLRSTFQEIVGRGKDEPAQAVRIVRGGNGQVRIFLMKDNGESSRPIPSVKREQMSKLLLDLAMLDTQLFAHVETAFDAVGDLEHLSDSLISVDDNHGEIDRLGFIRSFAEWGLEELNDVEQSISKLYSMCMEGAILTQHKMR